MVNGQFSMDSEDTVRVVLLDVWNVYFEQRTLTNELR
jgi:hypothetical protein